LGGDAYVLVEREARGTRLSVFPVASYRDAEDSTAVGRRSASGGGRGAAMPPNALNETLNEPTGKCDRTERPTDASSTQLVAMSAAKGSVSDADVRYLANRIGGGLDCGPGSRDANTALCPIGALRAGPFIPPEERHWYLGFSVDVVGSVTVGDITAKGVAQPEYLFIGPRELIVFPTGPENDCEREDGHRMVRGLLGGSSGSRIQCPAARSMWWSHPSTAATA
jgi:hypothetical protein